MQHITAVMQPAMLLENHQQPSKRINRKIRIVPVLLNRIKIKTKESYSAEIAVGETTSKKIASNSREESNQLDSTLRKTCLHL